MTPPRPRRAHVAMVSIPAPGHVHPNLGVIAELAARGHRVSYAVPGPLTDAVAAAGAEPVPYTSTLPLDEEWGDEYLDHVEPFLADNIAMLPQLADAFRGDEPDLLLYDIAAFCVRVLARRWNVPAVQLSPCMVAWEGYDEEHAELTRPLREDPRGIAHLARFRSWLEHNGFAGTDPLDFAGRPDRCLALIPRALQPHAEKVDESVYTFVGTCQGDRSREGDWQRPAGLGPGDRVLLVSLGSSFTHEPAFYRACLAAFGGLPGWHVVLQIGKHTDPAGLGPLPPNVELHRWVPQPAVLRQADAFLTHAGMGGCQEGLAAGVPMVAVPQAVDQFTNAALLQELGVARHIPKEEATAEALRTAVLELTADPGVARRLAEVREATLAEGGSRRAADLIEDLLPRP
ncbi:macrolide-inactivating glycosyltransferase [Streptomyces sodiiphilus]|uniref:Macrolide-inactivating glycosyltransferase n=1 Tax=Streptomyces sodiiphilus TaxID=226217 RepID=A0ABN2P5I8_9ACTN